MLELRPACENCNKPLPPQAEDAMICSFECTFCAGGVQELLNNVCPNCGGGFERRPGRPSRSWKGDNDTTHYPPSTTAKHRPVDIPTHRKFAAGIARIPPAKR